MMKKKTSNNKRITLPPPPTTGPIDAVRQLFFAQPRKATQQGLPFTL